MDHVWVGDVLIDAPTGEVLRRVIPQRRTDGDYMNGHVVDWLLLEAGHVPLDTLPIPF